MPAASVTTTATVALTIPSGAWGAELHNESDTTINYLWNANADEAGGDGAGTAIPAGGRSTIALRDQLSHPLEVTAYHGGSGSKSLVYDFYYQAMSAV